MDPLTTIQKMVPTLEMLHVHGILDWDISHEQKTMSNATWEESSRKKLEQTNVLHLELHKKAVYWIRWMVTIKQGRCYGWIHGTNRVWWVSLSIVNKVVVQNMCKMYESCMLVTHRVVMLSKMPSTSTWKITSTVTLRLIKKICPWRTNLWWTSWIFSCRLFFCCWKTEGVFLGIRSGLTTRATR